MCGITGILSCDPSNIYLERLKKMTDSVAHRGPDGEGYWMNPDGEVGFGHRRLSVIDLSESAAQPMHYLGKYTCIHNGEIYNYTELKQVLIARGYFFRTASDTEVLIAAYHCYGVECLSHFDGMFAFAIWDELEKTLFCARDRMGEKPFYYSFFENAFVFGSEAKVLWAAGLPKKVNEPMLLNFLSAGHVNTPLDLTISFYQQVFILPPAHYLRLSMPDLELSLHAYWDADKESMLKISEKEAEEKISHLFGQSLTRRLRSDVETGSTLSGGLDSSSIAAAIHGTGKFRQKTFSAVFPGYEKDESSYI
jgi:asparagine synthase (glutamine-hydrolysing)